MPGPGDTLVEAPPVRSSKQSAEDSTGGEESLNSGLKKWFLALSASTLFAAGGFIAAFGREQFLGVSSGDWSVQALITLAGRCAVDSFLLLIEFIGQDWGWFLLALLVALAMAVLARIHAVPAYARTIVHLCSIAVCIGFLLLVILRYEIPTIGLQDWVVSPEGQSPLSSAVDQLQQHTKHCIALSADAKGASVSAAPSAPPNEPLPTKEMSCYFGSQTADIGFLLLGSKSEQISDFLQSKGLSQSSPSKSKQIIDQRYAFSAAVCLLTLIYLTAFQASPVTDEWDLVVSLLRRSAYTLLLVASVFVPYVYGKVIDSTVLPLCDITYSDPLKTGKDVKPTSGIFPVISQTDKTISILWIQGHSGFTQVIEVPRERILALSFSAPVDALERIYFCQTLSGQGADPICQ